MFSAAWMIWLTDIVITANKASKGMCNDAVWSKRIDARPGNSSSFFQITRVSGILGNTNISTDASP